MWIGPPLEKLPGIRAKDKAPPGGERSGSFSRRCERPSRASRRWQLRVHRTRTPFARSNAHSGLPPIPDLSATELRFVPEA